MKIWQSRKYDAFFVGQQLQRNNIIMEGFISPEIFI